MEAIIESDHHILQHHFWDKFVERLESFPREEEIYIGLSGGSSLDIFYSIIREKFVVLPQGIRQKIRFCFLDERVVPVDHPDSNEGQLRKKFLDSLIENCLLEKDQILSIFSFLVPVIPAKAGIQISGILDSVLNTQGQRSQEFQGESYSHLVPRIDIGLFGVGPDGHIASLFPGHPLLDSKEEQFLEILDSPKPPLHRITVSPRMIEKIPYTFIAFMRGKEEAYSRFLDECISVKECPAKMLLRNKHLVVMSDIDE